MAFSHLTHLLSKIFQHLGHLVPFVLITLIVNSSLFLLLNFSAFDVIKYSAKSKPSNNSKFLLSVVIFSSASKLEPISLLALFSSIAIVASCLILKSCFHFSSKAGLSNFFEISGKICS